MPTGTEAQILVQADHAASAVAANGGGDVATFEARKGELEARRVADTMIAAEVRDSAIRLANLLENSGRPGYAKNKRENAQREYRDAVKAATDEYFTRLAMFAVSGGFTALVPADQMAAAAAASIRKQIAPVVTMLKNLQAAKIETVDLGEGTVWNVSERLTSFESIGLVQADATDETVSEG
jgi:hypothetical protein